MRKFPHEPDRWVRPHTTPEVLHVRPHDIDTSVLRAKLRSLGAELGEGFGSTGAILVHVLSDRSELVAGELIKQGLVEYAHPDIFTEGGNCFVPSDPFWGDTLDNFRGAWDLQQGGSVAVAVMDSGCTNNVDLGANILTGHNMATGTTDVTDLAGDSHGTACCSVLAANWNNGSTGGGVAGAGAGIKVVPIKFSDSGSFSGTVLTNALTFVATDGRAKIASCSSATITPYPQATQDEITAFWNAGNIFVASAGNAANTTTNYPAGHANCVAVSGTVGGSRDNVPYNYGPWTDTGGHYGIAAAQNYHAYNSVGTTLAFGGTSCSSPILCAALALGWSFKPTLTNQQLLDALIASGDPVGAGFGSPAHPAKALNAYRLLDSLRVDPRRASGGAPFGGF